MMGSECEGGDLTSEGYWGQLKAWGFSNATKVTELTYTMVGMQGEVINVPSPENKSPDERKAQLQLISAIHLGHPY